jgi:hypothetical protein
MFNVQIEPPTMPQLKRKSVGDLNEPNPKRQAVAASPVEQYHPYQPPRGFGPQLAAAQLPALPQTIHIQPRPSPNGYAASPVTSSPTIPASLPTPTAAAPTTTRKRGRPPKAEKEAQTRANNQQSTGYTPITPAPPIAPLPAYGGRSPGSAAAPPAYQVAPGPPSEPRPRRGRPSGSGSGSDKQFQAANVPRPTQASAADPGAQKMPPGDLEAAERWDRPPAPASQAPVPLEPPIQSRGSALHQAGPTSHNPIVPGALRDMAAPSIEHARNDGHAPVANQA